jgi:hypothetical protein
MKLSDVNKECWSVFQKVPGNPITGWEEHQGPEKIIAQKNVKKWKKL